MLRAFKTEIAPNEIQAQKIRQSIGNCRWLYDRYIAHNLKLYRMYQRGFLDDNQKYFLSGYDFDKFVNNKLKKISGEVRIVNRFFGSSKICHKCGFNKKDLKLKERIYKCPQCGAILDRDLNAALNLRDTNKFKIA